MANGPQWDLRAAPAAFNLLEMKPLRFFLAVVGMNLSLGAAPAPAILDEAKVPPYRLPDPLVCADGSKVRDAADWRSRRRPELLELFAREIYGRTPARKLAALHAEVTSVDRSALA